MQEENSNINKEGQVSGVVYLDSLSETASQKANNIKKTFKESKFYRNLLILNVIVFFVLLFWFLNDMKPESGGGGNIIILVLPIYQAFISVCIIIVYKIYRVLKEAYRISGKRIYLFILFVFILIAMTFLYSLIARMIP